jgi:hypothetical protein
MACQESIDKLNKKLKEEKENEDCINNKICPKCSEKLIFLYDNAELFKGAGCTVCGTLFKCTDLMHENNVESIESRVW